MRLSLTYQDIASAGVLVGFVGVVLFWLPALANVFH